MFTTHKIQGAGGVGGEDQYWLTTVQKTSENVLAYGIGPDNSNSIYASCQEGISGSYNALLLKFNDDGTVDFNKTLDVIGTEQFRDIIANPSGGVWVSGIDSPTSSNRGLITKYSSSGSVQLQKSYGPTGDYNYFDYVTMDSSDNLIFTGPMTKPGFTGTNYGHGIVKLDSSGSILWQKNVAAGESFGGAVSVDSSDNIYTQYFVSNYIHVIKFNSSGSVVWRKRFPASYARGNAIDSSDNLYISFLELSTQNASIIKINSSGTVQWCRETGVQVNLFQDNVFVDADDNAYLTGKKSGAKELFVFKYNSAGSLQWQRSLSVSGGSSLTATLTSTGIDNNGNVLLSGYTDALTAPFSSFFAKLPSDGSGTGTYGSFTYAATSETSTSKSVSTSNHSDPVSNASNSIVNVTGTESSISLTETTYEITP